MKRKIVTGVLCAVFMGIFLTGCSDTSEGKKQTDEKKEKIIIGVSSVSVDLGESGKKALEKKGYEVEVKVFDDYVLPNKALEEGSIDANLYQHEPYLDNYNKSNGKNMLPGTNAAPMHPNCRCAVTPYMDRKAFENWIEEKSIEKPDSSGIMNSSSTKEDIEVHSVGENRP